MYYCYCQFYVICITCKTNLFFFFYRHESGQPLSNNYKIIVSHIISAYTILA